MRLFRVLGSVQFIIMCERANKLRRTYFFTQKRRRGYYSAGNSKIKYKHNGTSTAAYWWLRSPSAGSSNGFVYVYTDGTVANYRAGYSLGFAPGFCV